MKIQIHNRFNNEIMYSGEYNSLRDMIISLVSEGKSFSGAICSVADLSVADLSGADLSDADLSDADLSDADLSGADLSGADLSDANLSGADLSDANLSGADLSDADLSGANLSGADLKNVVRNCVDELTILRFQAGNIRALKLVTDKYKSPMLHGRNGIPFDCHVGKILKSNDAERDERINCARGISVATPNWILHNYKEGYRIVLVEHKAKDIAAIPIGTDGKYRISKGKVVAEISIEELRGEKKKRKNK